ncbi:CPBP family intramembrane glutamic endopeptidase [Haloglomus halophilum]|uniref:CPBP family intramembrane glutamic endopeptidase n=1 Tax=Haloglomus halophilum TaxID=2962672 RepID=UPI0020C97FCE|nr:type II CAAX endopeptidase family protein [Haloglomus halophilum]
MDVRNWISEHRLVSFIAVTYAFTWTVHGALFQLGLPQSWTFSILAGLGAYGPVVGAAVVVWASDGDLRSWVMQAFRWRVHPAWWAVALLLPAGIIVGATGVFVLLGGELVVTGLETLVVYPFLLLYVLVIGGGQEELGWRGFAQPYLQERYGALAAALGIGVIWATWHAPLFIIPGATQSGFDFALYFGGILAESVILAWVYNNTGGSVLLAGLFHAGNNVAMNWYPVNNVLFVDGIQDEWVASTGQLAAFVVLALLVVAIVAAYGTRRLSRHPVPTPPLWGESPAPATAREHPPD